MVQVLATIFFSAAALSAMGVIVSSFADNLGDVRVALGLSPILPGLPSERVRVRRVEAGRGAAMLPAGSSQRAAA